MSTPNATPTIGTSVRLPVPVSRAVRAAAQMDERSQSQSLVKLLELGLAARAGQLSQAGGEAAAAAAASRVRS
jgi:hypothetical protein